MGIVGIVASLTIPNLIEKHQKKVTVTALKTAYSIFSQAVARSIQDNGDIIDWELSYSDMAPKYIFPYVETVGTVNRYGLRNLGTDGSSYIHWGGWTSGKIYAMKNGMTYSLIHDHGGIYLTVDINGKKGPNRMGRDGFVFEILPKENKLILAGANRTRYDVVNYFFGGCKNFTRSGVYYSGEFCGALIMIDGWEIKDYYPW